VYYEPMPPIRTLTEFTRMPTHFRKRGVHSAWADANRGGEAIDSFLEGPVFDAQGNLYVTDIPFGRVFKIDPDGEWTLVVEYDGEPNGMKFLNPYELLITDYKNGLMRLDIAAGKVSPFLLRRNSERFKGLNDLVFDCAGNLYFTDQGQTGLHDPTGRVYRLNADGKLDLLLSNVPSPNGIVLSPDEKILYVAATRGNCIWRAPLQRDGGVAKVGQFFTSAGPGGPDGLAMNEKGELLIANVGIGIIWVLNALGQPVDILRAHADGLSITNLAFGGAERKTLYCTESATGAILRAEMATPGADLPIPQP
jgi:gluconolactonase